MKAKHLILSFLVIFSSFAANALDSTKIAQRWKITKYAKKTHVIPHKEDDFMQFDPSHAFEEVIEGNYLRGKWSLNASTLTINNGKETLVWTLTELNAHSLKATNSHHEILEMEAQSLKSCTGDPYDDLTIICGKWKVADHKSHFTAVKYNPGDYIWFFPDGTAEEVFMGVYRKMTWKYDGESSQLTINEQNWKIKEIHQKKIVSEKPGKNETKVIVKL